MILRIGSLSAEFYYNWKQLLFARGENRRTRKILENKGKRKKSTIERQYHTTTSSGIDEILILKFLSLSIVNSMACYFFVSCYFFVFLLFSFWFWFFSFSFSAYSPQYSPQESHSRRSGNRVMVQWGNPRFDPYRNVTSALRIFSSSNPRKLRGVTKNSLKLSPLPGQNPIRRS